MTRVREEAARTGPRRADRAGRDRWRDHRSGRGPGGTFAALATLPVTALNELGFAVAFGILLDTIVVRPILVTALNLDLGRWMWWPGRLSRQPRTETAAGREAQSVRAG